MNSEKGRLDSHELITREEALKEFCRDISSRLDDKELFVLMHLADLRSAYDRVQGALSQQIADDAALFGISNGDTILNISKSVNVNYQDVRHTIHAFYLMGLVVKKASKQINAQEWMITQAGGQILNIIFAQEGEEKHGMGLRKRYEAQKKSRENV